MDDGSKTQEIRPEPQPGPAPEVERQAAAQSGEPPRWGKGTELAEDGRFLRGPDSRTSELARLLRIGADFVRGFPLIMMGTDYWQPLREFICHRMAAEKTILPADCERILFTDSVDEAMGHILGAATREFGLVWEAAPRWYFGESGLQKPGR